MKAQTLTINYMDLNEDCRTAKTKDLLILASNPYMLKNKVASFFNKNVFVNSWRLVNKYEMGNKGVNAGAYLYETIEELN